MARDYRSSEEGTGGSMNDVATQGAGELKRLADLLGQAPRVEGLSRTLAGRTASDIAAEAAAGLLDIRESAARLSNDLLPRLQLLSPESPEFEDVLDDIAEEYRHIHYHITHTALFSYVASAD